MRVAISEGHGDTALVLLKAGAETDKRDVDGHLAIELAPDAKVGFVKKMTPFCSQLLEETSLTSSRANTH